MFDNGLVAISKNKVVLTNLHTFVCVSWNYVKYECTNSIMIRLKTNMVTTQDYYSQILIA